MQYLPQRWRQAASDIGLWNTVSLIHIGIGILTIALAPILMILYTLGPAISILGVFLRGVLLIVGGVGVVVTGHLSLPSYDNQQGDHDPYNPFQGRILVAGWAIGFGAIGVALSPQGPLGFI